jgi:uridylate kinase
MKNRPVYNRVLLELSGEMMGGAGKAIDMNRLESLAAQLDEIKGYGVQIAVVIGAGNIWRGSGKQSTMNRPKADMVGMLATVVNALALQGALENSTVPACVLSAINFEPAVEVEHIKPYVGKQAIDYLQEGKIVIFGGGTGNPYFTTDTAAALRALQIEADVLLKATKVDGVYSSDPVVDSNARKFQKLGLEQALQMGLKVMDASAFSLCEENNLPVLVFALDPEGNTKKVIFGEEIGTMLTPYKSEGVNHVDSP